MSDPIEPESARTAPGHVSGTSQVESTAAERTTPRFFYFDLGNVILNFDRNLAYERLSEIARVSSAEICQFFEEETLQTCYELGKITSREFYARFCQRLATKPDYQATLEAASAMFQPNVRLIPVIAQLARANYRLGILSNTCEAHWEYCTDGRYGILRTAFEIHVLSYRVHAMKPDKQIYAAATEAAGLDPREIFFVDDLFKNVEAARRFGFDAVQYTSVPDLVAELTRRSVRFDY